MLCEICSKNEANINLVYLKDGEKKGIWTCNKCAKQILGEDFRDYISEDKFDYMKTLLSSLVDLSKLATNKKKIRVTKEKKCICCGLDYNKFRKNKILGCENCYSTFKDELLEEIRKVHFSSKHIGKYPKTNGNKYRLSRKIKELKKEMNIAINLQEYEKAAVIRDKLKVIKEEVNNYDE